MTWRAHSGPEVSRDLAFTKCLAYQNRWPVVNGRVIWGISEKEEFNHIKI